MDPELVQVAQIAWSAKLQVTDAEGPCAQILGEEPVKLVGSSLHRVLRTSEERARELDAKARTPDPPHVEFLSFSLNGGDTVLRLVLGMRRGEARAAVTNLKEVLAGAPPLQTSQLASLLSHEIRNPLSSVKMAIQTVARSASLSERDQRRLAIATREVRTIERMLGLLSEYGRDTPPNLDSVSLRALVLEAAALVEPDLQQRTIQVDVEDVSAVRARADAGRLRRVLSQLLLNVAAAQPEGSTLVVKILRTPQGSAITLRDPASPLPAEDPSSLFCPFGSLVTRSAGLSMAALHQVMQAHGGSVTAEADGEPGTLYTLRFPA